MDTTNTAAQCSGPARPRRIFSCYGDGAKAIPHDPEFLGWAGCGVMPIRADQLEVRVYDGGFMGPTVLCRLCYAAPGQLSACTDTGAHCNEQPTMWRATRPHDCPRPLRLLRFAVEFVAALHARDEVLAGARVVSASELGVTEVIMIEVRPGALAELRYSYGEPWLQELHGRIPPLAQDAIRDCWAAAREADPAQR